MKKQISIEEVIEFLNELIKIDEPAIRELLQAKVDCNFELSEHTTVQVSRDRKIGFLGLLNGMFGVYGEGSLKGNGPITAKLEVDKKRNCIKIIEFQETK